ncbi:hypothetical protein [Algoriphagus resistens]|uniref:hypothetical protein n=1 Tax=Algoriphagus resistens TaxID=1750590 RepID=UPI000716A8B1|nr:hypothetical protein [Algoriphagus resistens]
MDFSQISTRKIVIDILDMKERAKTLLQKDNAFNKFLEDLLNLDVDQEYENGYPTLKDISKRLDIKYDRLRRYLQDIYKILVENEDDIFFSFQEVEYTFYVFGRRDHSTSFTTKTLPVIPRLGETIDLPFFNAYFGSSTFYVNNVSYEFSGEMQKVFFDLRQGYFNPYWHFRKAQAEEEGELSFDDLMNLNEYQQKAKLGLGGYRAWK